MEAEEKYNTKLDSVWPSYTKTSQELAEFKKAEESRKQQELALKQQQGSALSPEETAQTVKAELSKYGVIFADDFDKYYVQRREGERILDQVNDVVKGAAEKGIKTTAQELIAHMQQEGFKNPNKAFKDLYETQLQTYDQEQLKKLKPDGLVTQVIPTAGGKQPPLVPLNNDNLLAQVSEALGQG